MCVCVCVCLTTSDYRLESFLIFSMHPNHLGCLLKWVPEATNPRYCDLDLSGAEKCEFLITIPGDTIGVGGPQLESIKLQLLCIAALKWGYLSNFQKTHPLLNNTYKYCYSSFVTSFFEIDLESSRLQTTSLIVTFLLWDLLVILEISNCLSAI